MVLFYSQASCNKRVKADAVILPFWKVNNKAKCAVAVTKDCEAVYQAALDNFTGKSSGMELLYSLGQVPEKRILLLGLGKNEELTSQEVLEAYARATRVLRKAKCKTINVLLPTISTLRISAEEFVKNLAAGMLSLNYSYPKYCRDNSSTDPLLTKVTVYGIVSKIAEPIFRREESIFEGVYLTRDLVNGNADDITPKN